jgi:large subunit ribosomal protein L3
MRFILGEKIGTTQIFEENGEATPVTVVEAGPVVVTQIKTPEKDSYSAVQIGWKEVKSKSLSNPQKGHLKNLGNLRFLREFRVSEEELTKFKVGDKIDASVFSLGDLVNATSVSKAKGFQGVVKRHGFHGGPRSHGQKHSEREAGSIGATGPQRVFKGKKMPGRMGGEKVTVRNLKVVNVDSKANRLFIKGAVPGRRGTLVEIKSMQKEDKETEPAAK